MPRTRPSRRSASSVLFIVGLLVLLPLLYVGGMRPAYRYVVFPGVAHDSVPMQPLAHLVHRFYWPLWWAGERWAPLNRAVHSWAGFEYVSLEVPHWPPPALRP